MNEMVRKSNDKNQLLRGRGNSEGQARRTRQKESKHITQGYHNMETYHNKIVECERGIKIVKHEESKTYAGKESVY